MYYLTWCPMVWKAIDAIRVLCKGAMQKYAQVRGEGWKEHRKFHSGGEE